MSTLTDAERCGCGHDPGDHSVKGACRMCFARCPELLRTELSADEKALIADRCFGGAAPSSLLVRAIERIIADRLAKGLRGERG